MHNHEPSDQKFLLLGSMWMGRASADPQKIAMQETNNKKEDISTGEGQSDVYTTSSFFPRLQNPRAGGRARP